MLDDQTWFFEVPGLSDEEISQPSPKAEVRKVPTTIRFDADVLEAMKATGPGWQTRINDIAREYVEAHREHWNRAPGPVLE